MHVLHDSKEKGVSAKEHRKKIWGNVPCTVCQGYLPSHPASGVVGVPASLRPHATRRCVRVCRVLHPFLPRMMLLYFSKTMKFRPTSPRVPPQPPSLCCLLHARNPAAELRFPRRLIGLSSPPADMRDESGSEESLLALPSMRLGLD